MTSGRFVAKPVGYKLAAVTTSTDASKKKKRKIYEFPEICVHFSVCLNDRFCSANHQRWIIDETNTTRNELFSYN